jgi:hypothetical protein
MSYYILAALANLQTGANQVNTAKGYPLAGTDIGGGVHVPPSQSVTTRWAPIWQHPTLTQFAYQADATVVGVVGPNAITLGLPAPAALDATWFPSSGPVATVVGG